MYPTISSGEQIVQYNYVQCNYSASLCPSVCHTSLASTAIKMKFKALNRFTSVDCTSLIITRTLLILPETPSEKVIISKIPSTSPGFDEYWFHHICFPHLP